MSRRIGKALFYSALLWLTGFVWGSIVFMTPTLKNIAPIPYVSVNPAISIPILLVWSIVAYCLARNYLKAAVDRAGEGLRLGLVFATVNILVDLVMLGGWLEGGLRHFTLLAPWVAYLLLFLIPWWVGREGL